MTKPKGPGKPNKSWCWAERAEEIKMPELIKLIVGVGNIIGGGILIGLLILIKELTGRLTPLWIWIFSICVVCGGIHLIFAVKI